MNKLERWVYERVKDNVWLKNAVKYVYQRGLTLFTNSNNESNLTLIERQRSFFGFHDKSPWSSNGKLLLGHTFEGIGNENWKSGRPVSICIFEGDGWTKKSIVARTNAWNWQQGAQLQWMGKQHQVIYNDFRDGRCVSIQYDLRSGKERIIEYPLAALSPDGLQLASICFKTFGEAMEGYGYAFGANYAISSVPPAELIVADVAGGNPERLQLADLDTQIQPCEPPEGIDFFSHCLFSPDSTKLLFLRRQARENRRLRSEMFCVDLENQSVERLPFHNMVSHFTWLGNQKVLAYANTVGEGDGYYCVNLPTGEIENWSHMLQAVDGHPHATRSGHVVVYDTYPDRKRYQHLYLWSRETKQSTRLAKLYAPLKFWGPLRVDLHPRVHPDGSHVCFDASYNGIRSLVTAQIGSSI